MTKKMKKRMKCVIAGGVIFFATSILTHVLPNLNTNIELILFLIAYFIVGGDVVKKAVQNIGHGQIFDENFLMMIATVGAFLVGEYPEGVAVMLFYQVGELFQSYAVNKSRKSISQLMDIRPDYANVYRDGEVIEVDPTDVSVGDVILIKPGERVPLDGVVRKGTTSLDTMALTGESIPRDAMSGEEVISGCVNITGVIDVEVTKEFGDSICKILYANCCNMCSPACNYSTACSWRRLRNLGLPCIDFSGNLMSLCLGNINSPKFFRWNRRSRKSGCVD